MTLGTWRVPPDHPSLPGHFPGAPVLPGVVLLDRLLAALLAAGWEATALPTVRLLAPVLPGDLLELSAAPARDGALALAVTRGGTPVLRARALVRPAPNVPARPAPGASVRPTPA